MAWGRGGGGQEWVAALDTFNLREGSKWADQRGGRGNLYTQFLPIRSLTEDKGCRLIKIQAVGVRLDQGRTQQRGRLPVLDQGRTQERGRLPALDQGRTQERGAATSPRPGAHTREGAASSPGPGAHIIEGKGEQH